MPQPPRGVRFLQSGAALSGHVRCSQGASEPGSEVATDVLVWWGPFIQVRYRAKCRWTSRHGISLPGHLP